MNFAGRARSALCNHSKITQSKLVRRNMPGAIQLPDTPAMPPRSAGPAQKQPEPIQRADAPLYVSIPSSPTCSPAMCRTTANASSLHRFNGGLEGEYRVRLGPAPADPKQVDVEFSVLNGPIRAVVDLHGHRHATLDATTVNGSIRLHVKRQDAVGLSVSSANGAVHLWLPRGYDGILSAATGNGSVALSDTLQKYAVIVPGEKGCVWHVRVPEDMEPHQYHPGNSSSAEITLGHDDADAKSPRGPASEKSDADSRVVARRESDGSEGDRKPGPDRAKAETANGKVRVYVEGEKEEAGAWWEGSCEVM